MIHRETGKPFSLTRTKKSSLNSKTGEALCREIRLLAGTLPHHPFLLNLYWTWQDEEYLYRIDDVQGGDSRKRPLNGDELLKWACQLALVIHYIHSYGLVHGNINPLSISVSPQSRDIRLGSFAHLRGVEGGRRLTGVCGDVEEFRAPECSVKSESAEGEGEGEEGYFEEIDWYAYGKVLSFWGGCDHNDENVDINLNVNLNTNVNVDLRNLTKRLTEKIPESRLGYGPSAFKSIQSHPFLAQTETWPSPLTSQSFLSHSSLTASIETLKRTASLRGGGWTDFVEFSWDLEGQVGQTLESIYRGVRRVREG